MQKTPLCASCLAENPQPNGACEACGVLKLRIAVHDRGVTKRFGFAPGLTLKELLAAMGIQDVHIIIGPGGERLDDNTPIWWPCSIRLVPKAPEPQELAEDLAMLEAAEQDRELEIIAGELCHKVHAGSFREGELEEECAEHLFSKGIPVMIIKHLVVEHCEEFPLQLRLSTCPRTAEENPPGLGATTLVSGAIKRLFDLLDSGLTDQCFCGLTGPLVTCADCSSSACRACARPFIQGGP
jgi:hypothetical protein